MTEIYIPCNKTLFTATQATNTKTGEVIKLTSDHKMIYFWCLDQYKFFNSQGKKYYETWEDILSVVGLSYERKAKRIIKDLSMIGLIVSEGSKKTNHKLVKAVGSIKDWTFNNPSREKLSSVEHKTARTEAKNKRFEEYKSKKAQDVKDVESPIVDTPTYTPTPSTPTFESGSFYSSDSDEDFWLSLCSGEESENPPF